MSVFSCIRTEQRDLIRKSPYSVRIQENTDQKQIRIWTLFTQCILTDRSKMNLKRIVNLFQFISWNDLQLQKNFKLDLKNVLNLLQFVICICSVPRQNKEKIRSYNIFGMSYRLLQKFMQKQPPADVFVTGKHLLILRNFKEYLSIDHLQWLLLSMVCLTYLAFLP